MTTAHSPLHRLKAQADEIAARLKNTPDNGKAGITFAVAMDDKILKIDMPWKTIREIGEVELSAYILKHMKEDTTQ